MEKTRSIYSFDEIDQYSTQFNKLFADYPKAKRGFASPYFSILTARSYMENCSIGSDSHKQNVERAVNISVLLESNKSVQAEYLLELAELKEMIYGNTTSEKLKDQSVKMIDLIPDLEYDFVMIFMKNGIFFVVIGDTATNSYHIRDIDRVKQYAFLNKIDLIQHLNSTYQFNQPIDLDGFKIPEYSSIKWVIINQPFLDKMDQMVGDKLIGTVTKKPSEFNGIYGDDEYPNLDHFNKFE
jgi:hypothetical protein